MGLDKLVYWYQKKIGTYDKQQWERTVEQRIFGGLTNVPMRTAKLKTEFIDVDLVRGSSFPKAKAKHGLVTVTWLAVKQLVFLPFYKNWWIQQTSFKIFLLFFFLYCLQIFNIYIYLGGAKDTNDTNMVTMTEVLMPVVMMFILCTVHSQIVSTNSDPITVNGHKRSRMRRSRNERNRSGKLRTRRNPRYTDQEISTQDISILNESSGKIYPTNVTASVKFSKKVCINMKVLTATGTSEKLQVERIVANSRLPNNETIVKTTVDIDVPSCSKITEEKEIIEKINNDKIQSSIDTTIIKEENTDIVQQDDDGFESLNGNLSSDNDPLILSTQTSLENDDLLVNKELLINKETRNSSTDNSNNCLDVNIGISNCLGKTSTPEKKQCESEEEGECEDGGTNQLTEATTSATEWLGVTTNSDDCSYSSDINESEGHSETNNFGYGEFVEHPFSWDLDLQPSILLNSSCTASDRVSCTIWTRGDIKKAELSVLDISSSIIAKAESMPESMDYFYGGLVLSIILAVIPSIRRLSDYFSSDITNNLVNDNFGIFEFAGINLQIYTNFICKIIDVAFGSTLWERTVLVILSFERFILSCLLFFLLGVAERTFKQRLLYAKLFSHLTSSRRARKSELPHFRLNKVRNIKTWLSVRSYLKRRGPQRSVDVIVSAVFIVTLLLLSFVSLELIKDLESLQSRYNIEALFWSFTLGIYILRFMTLGTKINKKYRNLSVLITEQINLYLQIEQKPHKKDELTVANSVLKLAADLIKELESPFKISGLSANPYLYTITKVVLLSALSGVLSELLGFKLKLHKISIK